ncbi:DUF2490 domain-containing protein [Candidatus Dependentiae bacterium]|nr:DUF2490 domain-containing protein [Candidatus Dependentiae bacterium]
MKINLYVLFCLIFLVFIQLYSFADETDEYWCQNEISNKINDNIKLKFKPVIYFNDNCSKHFTTFFEFGFDCKINNIFTLGPYFRYINIKTDTNWKLEVRPHLNLSIKIPIGLKNVSLSDNNRLEYRIRNNNNAYRFRNKLTVKYSRFKIIPNIGFEVFYDFKADEFNRMRFYAGVDFKIMKSTGTGIGYILQKDDCGEEWKDRNIYTTTLKVSF